MLTKRRSDSAILLTFLVEMSATRVVASPITMEVAASTFTSAPAYAPVAGYARERNVDLLNHVWRQSEQTLKPFTRAKMVSPPRPQRVLNLR